MSRPKRIFFVDDLKEYTGRFILSTARKHAKGFIRLGHDVHRFDYLGAFWHLAPVKSKVLSRKRVKNQVDELLVKQLKSYDPDIIRISFCNFVDVETIFKIRQAVPNAFLYGFDGDPWPELQRDRVQVGAMLDLVLATNNGKWLEVYRKAGVKAVFMPNVCDPDIECRHNIPAKYATDILFTGKTRKTHKRLPTDPLRFEVVEMLKKTDKCKFYGCLGQPKIGGMDYIYVICGAKMALSINIINDVSLYHSDRLTNYLSMGTLALSRRVPDTDLLFKDQVHLRYFDTVDEFFEIADWYLEHEPERKKIADAGMQHVHDEFNIQKIAKYTIDVIENGTYSAPWSECLI